MGHGGSAGTMDFKAPPGASNSNHLGNLLTPSTRRIRSSCTPGSRSGVRKLRFDDTPAFLRRDSRHAHVGKENFDGDEGEELSWSPVAVRKITRPAGRGLSALVKGLREMEDDQLDEDLDILRERENDTALSSKIDQTQTLVKDSQRYDMPLGPDGGFESDENDGKYEDEGKGRDGNPLKVWKKKGQKRTTRRILLKPNTEKWKPETAWKGGCDGDAEEVCVAETQIANAEGKRECQSGMFNSDKTSEEQAIRGVEKLSNGEKEAKDICEKKGSIAKTVKKKISATAHANFRALKIKNKQSKAKGRRRFGGRR